MAVKKPKTKTSKTKQKDIKKPGNKPKPNQGLEKKFELKLQFNLKKLLIWVLIGFLILSFILSLRGPVPQGNKPLAEVLNDIKNEKVKKIEVEGESLYVYYHNDNSVYLTRKEPQESFTEVLKNADIDPTTIDFEIKDQSMLKAWGSILELALPVILTGVIFLWIFRQARGAQDSIFAFGRSKAKLFAKGKQNIKFADVGGIDEAKEELKEIVDFLKNPKKYRALGARTPKGVLLVGPAGCGKTLLAKAVAGEAGVPFFSMAGSEFMEMLVGVGASRVRDLFSTAKKAAPAIIFIDEIDAIGRVRGLGAADGHDEREQTLNQILVEMDGFTPNDHVIVVAASVTGKTPILVKEDKKIKLMPIGSFVDKYYQKNEENGEKEVNGIKVLGFAAKKAKGNLVKNNLYFSHSDFVKIRSVFRHKVDHIYRIKFLGGEIEATGNHSVFIRTSKGLTTKAVSQLKPGDLLVDLPLKVNRTTKSKREIRTHKFDKNWSKELAIWDQKIIDEWQPKHQFAMLNKNILCQDEIASQVGVSQATISLWHREINGPRALSKNYYKHSLPEKVKVTPKLMRLFGYYIAEGYARDEIDFCFNINESHLVEDLVKLMQDIFGLQPDRFRYQTPGAVNIIYNQAGLAKFFIRYVGKGAANKHIPSFLFEAPFEYFQELLRGIFRGDGHKDKKGRGEITSISKRLILELNWLCRMHGIKTYLNSFTAKAGRRISGGKPLKETVAWRLGWGKSVDPFKNINREQAPWCRAIVKKVTKTPYAGYVYDLCGCDNEAFFGGEAPVLLHNTNRGDLLDTALMRPGRFDRRVVLEPPDIEGRKKILQIHRIGKPFDKTVNWDRVAKRTVGFTGADLENMLNEAAILAARHNQKSINWNDIEEAATKVKLGPEKKRLQTDLDKKMTAYHEAGHALVTFKLPNMDSVHRVSIVSRGMALGYTLIPPKKDRIHETKTHLLQTITSLLGGRAAEEIKFKEFTTGAASDITRATQLARKMVIEFGMSDLGPINLGPQIDVAEWGRTYYEPSQISPKMAAKVDQEIKSIVDQCYQQSVKILKNNQPKLDLIVKKLMEKETIEADEFEELMKK